MVRTLPNAFAAGRIPQAWMLTGVRGVGKTTTARILARAPELPDAGRRRRGRRSTCPSFGVHCEAIIEGRHIDVLEIDAASHTRRRQRPPDQRRGALFAGLGALQGLHHRRGAHALGGGLQRLPEDAGGAAAARQVHLRDDRDPQGAGDDPVALPALRPAPRRGRRCSSRISPASARPKASRPRTRRWPRSRAPPKARCAIRSRSSTRPSPMAAGAISARRRARHARPRRPRPRSSTCSRR